MRSCAYPYRRPGVPRRAAATLSTLFVCLAVLLPARPADAGGPTSVLLASPDRSTTTSLYHSDRDYARLASLTEIPATGGSREERPATTHGQGPYVTVTWLIHDVRVWRVDRVFVEAPGGPWIATQEVMDADGTPNPRATAHPGPGPARQQPAVWHAAAEPQKLIDLLDDLGLLEQGATAPPREPAAASTAGTGGDDRAWSWAAPGVAVGVLLGAAGSWYVARRPRPRFDWRKPSRQELLDG